MELRIILAIVMITATANVTIGVGAEAPIKVNAEKMSDEERYNSGFEHGCSDSHIWDSSERYINQEEKGFAYHTSAFNQGYHDGFEECGYDGGVLSYSTGNIEEQNNVGIENSYNNRDSVVQPQQQTANNVQSNQCPKVIVNGDCLTGQEMRADNQLTQANRADN